MCQIPPTPICDTDCFFVSLSSLMPLSGGCHDPISAAASSGHGTARKVGVGSRSDAVPKAGKLSTKGKL